MRVSSGSRSMGVDCNFKMVGGAVGSEGARIVARSKEGGNGWDHRLDRFWEA